MCVMSKVRRRGRHVGLSVMLLAALSLGATIAIAAPPAPASAANPLPSLTVPTVALPVAPTLGTAPGEPTLTPTASTDTTTTAATTTTTTSTPAATVLGTATSTLGALGIAIPPLPSGVSVDIECPRYGVCGCEPPSAACEIGSVQAEVTYLEQYGASLETYAFTEADGEADAISSELAPYQQELSNVEGELQTLGSTVQQSASSIRQQLDPYIDEVTNAVQSIEDSVYSYVEPYLDSVSTAAAPVASVTDPVIDTVAGTSNGALTTAESAEDAAGPALEQAHALVAHATASTTSAQKSQLVPGISSSWYICDPTTRDGAGVLRSAQHLAYEVSRYTTVYGTNELIILAFGSQQGISAGENPDDEVMHNPGNCPTGATYTQGDALAYAKDFAKWYTAYGPTGPQIKLAMGVDNSGIDSTATGTSWAKIVHQFADYVHDTVRTAKIDPWGGGDLETGALPYSDYSDTSSWEQAYNSHTTAPLVDYGASSCPSTLNQWSPNDSCGLRTGWTTSSVWQLMWGEGIGSGATRGVRPAPEVYYGVDANQYANIASYGGDYRAAQPGINYEGPLAEDTGGQTTPISAFNALGSALRHDHSPQENMTYSMLITHWQNIS